MAKEHDLQNHHEFYFYWSIVNLQCCANLGCIVKWLSCTLYTFFLIFFSIMVYHKRLSIVPCATLGPYSRTSLFIHSPYSSLHLPTPSSYSIPLLPASLLETPSLFSVSLFLFCREVHLCHVLDSTSKWYHMILSFSFWLTSLSVTISSCIHVSTDGIILFFFMTE